MFRASILLGLLLLLTAGLAGCTIPIGKHHGEPITEFNPLEILFSDDDDCCDGCCHHHHHH